MTFDPVIPPLIAAVAALAALAAAVLCYRRPGVAAAARVASLGVIALMLANPVQELPVPVRVRPKLAVVVDSSASMATDDCRARGRANRYEDALATARLLAGRLSAGWDVSIQGLGADGLSAAPPAQPGGDTDYAGLAALADGSVRTAVLIGDGADWNGSTPELALARAGVAVHCLAIGQPKPAVNASVTLRSGSATVEPGQDLMLTALVTASPGLRGTSARLVVSEMSEGRDEVLASRELALSDQTAVEITAPASTVHGARLWRAVLTVPTDEVTREDNTSWASAGVVDRSRSVGVVEGRAWWDTSFAVRAWRRDKQWTVSVLHRLGKQQRGGGDLDLAGLSDATLAKLDTLVLGSGLTRTLTAADAERIATFVDRGGGLLLLAPGATGLAAIDAIDPMHWGTSRGSAQAEAANASLPGLLPAGSSFPITGLEVAGTAPQAQILLGPRDRPLVVRRRHGAGWVCHANLDGVWRWQLTGAGGAGDDAGERFWRQLLRGLSTGSRGSLRPERTEVGLGGEMAVWVQPDGDARVMLTDPDGTRTPVSPSGGVIRLRADRTGLWRFDQGDNATVVVCRQIMREQLECSRDDARLMRLAKATGGTCGEITAVEDLARRLSAATATATATTRATVPLITSPWWLATLVPLLVLEWWWRRRRLGAV